MFTEYFEIVKVIKEERLSRVVMSLRNTGKRR